MAERRRVFIVDDDAAICEAIAEILGLKGFEASTFLSAEDFLATVDPSAGGCIILDLCLPGMDGLELQQELANRQMTMPVIFLTGNADISSAVAGLQAGAVNFLEKPFQPSELVELASRAVELDCKNRAAMAHCAEILQRISTLTNREREILELIVDGKSTKQIASLLGTSDNTVRNQRVKIYTKMQVDCIADLVRVVTIASPPGSGQPGSDLKPDP